MMSINRFLTIIDTPESQFGIPDGPKKISQNLLPRLKFTIKIRSHTNICTFNPRAMS
jgi:hypothetical protein